MLGKAPTLRIHPMPGAVAALICFTVLPGQAVCGAVHEQVSGALLQGAAL